MLTKLGCGQQTWIIRRRVTIVAPALAKETPGNCRCRFYKNVVTQIQHKGAEFQESHNFKPRNLVCSASLFLDKSRILVIKSDYEPGFVSLSLLARNAASSLLICSNFPSISL